MKTWEKNQILISSIIILCILGGTHVYIKTIKIENDFNNVISIMSLFDFEVKTINKLDDSEIHNLNNVLENMIYMIEVKEFNEFKELSNSMLVLSKQLIDSDGYDKEQIIKEISRKNSLVSTKVIPRFDSSSSLINRVFTKYFIIIQAE